MLLLAKANNIFEKENNSGGGGKIPLRENGKIVVSHTPRAFPTPVRESQTPQEEEVESLDSFLDSVLVTFI